MKTDSIKQSIISNYGKLAKSTQNGLSSDLFSCCNPSDTVSQIAQTIGYSQDVLDSVPKESNLGVGCGNPSALANIKKGETVIDLGSGAGFDAFIVSRMVQNEGSVIGIDLSDEMLALANENLKKGDYSNVSFIKGDIESLPLDNEIAEHVISNCVINLSLNKTDVFKEAYRVLKSGGKLSISDIVLEKELPDIIKNSLMGHVACVSGAEKLEVYLQYVRDAGFREIKIESKSDFPLELMLTDPQITKIAHDMNFDQTSEEARDIASRVKSISLSAIK